MTRADKARRTVALSTDGALLAKATVPEYDGLAITNLAPGRLVTARVAVALPDGLLVSFLSVLTGSVRT